MPQATVDPWEQQYASSPPAAAGDAASGGFDPTPAENRMLAEIKQRESSGNYGAHNPQSTASGAYQFINSTWRLASQMTGVPKYATAAEAPKDVQDVNALYMLRNYGPNAKITWAASGPYTTGRGTAARSEAVSDAGAASAVPADSGSPDILERIARGEQVKITPQDILRIAFGDSETPKPAVTPPVAGPTVTRDPWEQQYTPAPTPPQPPPEPSPIEKAGRAFAEGTGISTLVDLLGGASRDPVRAQRAQQAFQNVVSGIAGEPSRVWGELSRTGEAMTRADLPGTAWHLAGAVPFLGPATQQIAQDIARGDPAAAVGHTGALVAPLVAGPVARAVGRGTAATAEATGSAVKAAASKMADVASTLDPDVIGIVSPRAAHTVRTMQKIGKVIDKYQAAKSAAEAAAGEMTPGQAYAASQGIDWATLNANDQAMLEHAARAQANAAAQPAPAPAPPAAPPVAEPAAPLRMTREQRRATAALPQTGTPESVARAMAEREAIIGKPREQWTNADVLAADALRAEGYTGAGGAPAPAPTPTPAPPAAEPVPPPPTPPSGAAPAAAPAAEPDLEQQLAESIQQAQARKPAPSLEEKARGNKVDKLFDAVQRNEIPLSMLDTFGDVEWKMLAEHAGVKPPSEASIAQLKRRVAAYEGSRNVPVTKTTTPAEAQAAFEQARATRRGAVPEHVDAILNAIPRVKYTYAKTFKAADWAALEDAAGTGETSPATRDAILEGIRQRELPPKK